MKTNRAVKLRSRSMKKVKKVKKKPLSLAKKVTGKIKSLLKTPPKPEPKVKAISSKDKAKLLKQDEARKKAYSDPFHSLLNLWKPKTESFDQAMEAFFKEFPSTEKDAASANHAITEKILLQMRKYPISSEIEQQFAERFSRERIHKIGSILSMKPKTVLRLNILKADLLGFGQSGMAETLKIKRSQLSPWAFEIGKPEGIEQNPAYQRGLF